MCGRVFVFAIRRTLDLCVRLNFKSIAAILVFGFGSFLSPIEWVVFLVCAAIDIKKRSLVTSHEIYLLLFKESHGKVSEGSASRNQVIDSCRYQSAEALTLAGSKHEWKECHFISFISMYSATFSVSTSLHVP